MKIKRLLPAFAVLLTAAVVTPAPGQDNSSNQRNRQNQGQSDQANNQQRNRQQASQRQRSQQANQRQRNNQQRNQQQSNRGQSQQDATWIRVAYDFDNDGSYDSVSYLYIDDVKQAQQQSKKRAKSQQAQNGRKSNQRKRVSGTITNMGLKSLSIGKGEKEHRFAIVEKQDGKTCRVMLGTEEKVSQLDIQQGDQVTVEGVLAKVDDKDVLLAERVSTGNNSITNQLPPCQKWEQCAGKIQRLRRTDQGRSAQHAVVQLRNSKNQIDLGPTSELQELDLQEGDQVTLLARQGRVGGKRMMIAQKIRSQGTTVDVREATDRSIRQGAKKQQNQQR